MDEGIDDLQTFLELDSNDFARLQLRTKVIKLIQRMQKEFCVEDIELIEEERLEDNRDENLAAEHPNLQDEDVLGDDVDYRGILMEEVVDINLIFNRSKDGRAVMELLKEGRKPDDDGMTAIKKVLCGYLKAVYGLHPGKFHKNILAQSLVRTYPALASSTPDIPQALWFHQDGRGKNRHSGRLHYHMEYLARKSGVRVVNRQRHDEGGDNDADPAILPVPDPEVDMEAATKELKFLSAGPNTKLRAEELWRMTFTERKSKRQNGSIYEYVETNSVSTAFNGFMISLEFSMMYPNAPNFQEKLEELQPKVLARYRGLFIHVKDDFIRMLMIIRKKTPSRGAKRTRDLDPTQDSTLKGIVEWIKPEDPYPETKEVPVLYVKGNFLESGSSAAIIWKRVNVLMEPDMKHCFRVLCESLVVFGTVCQPTDKQFYSFVSNVFLGVGDLTTTGQRLLQSVE